MSDGRVDMSLDDIIKLGKGRGGRGRGAGRGMRGRGRGRGVGMGRGAVNQQRPATRQLQQRGRGTFRGRAQGQSRGFRRGSGFAGRGQTRTLSTNTSFNKQQLGVKSGGIIKRRIGNIRGRARGGLRGAGGRGGMLNLKTAIRSQLQQTQQSPGRGRGRGKSANRGGRNPANTTQEPFKNFQVSVKGLGSQSNDPPEGVQMASTFSVNHTTGITLNSRFTPNEGSSQSSNRLITANGRAVKHF